MAEQESSRDDRHLPATEKRLRDAAKRGQVARSRDLGHALVLGAALGCLMAWGPGIAQRLHDLVRSALTLQAADLLKSERMATQLANVAFDALLISLPLLVCLMAAGFAGSVLLSGFNWAPAAAAPSWQKISPASGLARLFSRQSAIELIKLLCIATAVLVIGFWFALDRLPEVAGLAQQSVHAAGASTVQLSFTAFAWMAGTLVLVACFDVPWQWWQHRDQLKMSHQELREESREADGDPLIKAKIRAKQREMSRSRMLAAVPQADVVVTNPTHFSVALKYDAENMGAPRVVAKGADELAFRIREVARESGVALLEAPPLARALYKHAEVDQEIPAALYAAVAQVLAYVYQLRNFVPGLGKAPETPTDLPVPPELDPSSEASP